MLWDSESVLEEIIQDANFSSGRPVAIALQRAACVCSRELVRVSVCVRVCVFVCMCVSG